VCIVMVLGKRRGEKEMSDCKIHKDQPTCHTCNNYGNPECPFYPEEPTFPEGDGIGACIRHPLAVATIRNEVLDEMIKLTTMIETSETERWGSLGRPKNDGYINGSHSGYGHALRDMRQWINDIKKAGMKK
jgi:hypothetical protein